MTLGAILDTLKARGVRLTRDGGDLIATPKSALTDDLRALIRAHKPELLETLGDASRLAPGLELGIRAMSTKWGYSPDELQWALEGANKDPVGWALLIEFDRQRTLQ